MATIAKSLVFGYVRSNYQLYIPEVIIKTFLLFYDPEITIKIKGNNFYKLQKTNGNSITRKVKFNQYSSFILKLSNKKGLIGLSIKADMAQNVDYCSICFEILCVETQTVLAAFYKIGKERINANVFAYWSLRLSQGLQQQALTFKFNIRSLELKYKNDENKDEILFYPSLKARLLKQETRLNWDIDVNKLKDCIPGRCVCSKIMDNYNIVCFPKGIMQVAEDGFFAGIHLMSYPLNISKMVIVIKIIFHVNASLYKEHEDEIEMKLSQYETKGLNCGFSVDGIDLKYTKEMNIETKVVVKKLYDMNGMEIPEDEWKDHNVEISQDK